MLSETFVENFKLWTTKVLYAKYERCKIQYSLFIF